MNRVLELIADSPDSPRAAPLVAALISEMEVRYAANLTVPYDAAAFQPPDGIFVIALEDGQAIGCGGFIRFDARTAELKRMYVAPDSRGRGLGRILLDHLEEAARDAGYSRIVLETGNRQPDAVALYRKAGYSEIPRYPPYTDREVSRCWGRELTTHA